METWGMELALLIFSGFKKSKNIVSKVVAFLRPFYSAMKLK
jgi:hypothetical protein